MWCCVKNSALATAFLGVLAFVSDAYAVDVETSGVDTSGVDTSGVETSGVVEPHAPAYNTGVSENGGYDLPQVQRCQPENIVATTPQQRFYRHGDGTVTDNQTGLMWRTCLAGLNGRDCAEGEPRAMTWAQALQYAPSMNQAGGFAGYRDWRLANIRELSTLAELQCEQPAINLAIFPGTTPSQVWSSSPYHFYTHYSWYVDFSNGAPTYDERIRQKMVRVVRDAD